MKRVCIIQPVLKTYRVPFFLGLHEALGREGIQLELQYGTPWPTEALRGDNERLKAPWCHEVRTVLLPAGMMLQPAVRTWWGADLVVLEHANKHLQNYMIAALKGRAFHRLAYWGHGRNRQGDAASRGERLKRRSLHWADWWFAYTAGSAAYVREQGFPPACITTVENAVDTTGFQAELRNVTASQREELQKRLSIRPTDIVGLYCGSLYPHKRLDVLLAAAKLVNDRLPGFRLLVVGGGPQAGWMTEQAALHPSWLSYDGPRFGAEKAACFSIAHIFLNPGLVGLAILDAFCAGLPMLTADIPTHSPEIEYLVPRKNGLMSAPDAASFASTIAETLMNPSTLSGLQRGALESAKRYTIGTMIENFNGGIVSCLRQ